jgi:hypothetical protein
VARVRRFDGRRLCWSDCRCDEEEIHDGLDGVIGMDVELTRLEADLINLREAMTAGDRLGMFGDSRRKRERRGVEVDMAILPTHCRCSGSELYMRGGINCCVNGRLPL